VIAAVLLLHERSVEEIVPQLSPLELEKVIELVGRSPRLYPRGILEALDQHRSLMASALTPQSVLPSAAAKEEAKPSASAAHPPRSGAQPSFRTGADARQSPPERAKGVGPPSPPHKPSASAAHPPRSGAQPSFRTGADARQSAERSGWRSVPPRRRPASACA
jgi:hypothetical protein